MLTRRAAFIAVSLTSVCLLLPPAASAGRIDATPGRDYSVTKEHGPWMICVATFKKTGVDRPDEIEGENADETVALEAAQKLVLELRQKGLPAYVFELQKERQTVVTQSRSGERQVRKTMADDAQYAVLAGNYTSNKNDVATKSLAWVKQFNPASFGTEARYRLSPGRRGPLAGAFLTINPLLSQAEVAARTIDEDEIKLLKKLNAGNEFPLHECGGKYTLIVKDFSGRTVMKSKAGFNKNDSWDESTMMKSGEVMGKAGYDAWRLCAALRNRGVDAYLWHEKYRSIVTVGAFNSADDPGVRSYKKRFGADVVRDRNTGYTKVIPKTEPPMQNGVIQASGTDQVFEVFNTEPQLIPVPELPKTGLFRF